MDRTRSLSYNGRRHLPLPCGPYSVGCTDIMTSHSRAGVFIRLYYPTGDRGLEEHYLEWTPWITNKEYVDGYAMRAGWSQVLFRFIHYWFVGDVYIPAIWQGVIAQDNIFPVVIFSHGLASFRNSYSSVCLELASHGFVVACVEHRDGTACATYYMKPCRMSSCGEYPASSLSDLDELLNANVEAEWQNLANGEWEPGKQVVAPNTFLKEWMYYKKVDGDEGETNVIRGNQVKKRAQECIIALDVLESLNKGNPVTNLLDPNFRAERFVGRLNLKQAVVMGHSFGGATAILSMAMDSRFRMGIALDPWMVPLEVHKNTYPTITQPLLVVSTDGFQDETSMEALKTLRANSVERTFLTIKEAQHRDQSDLPFIGGTLFSYMIGNSTPSTGFITLELTAHLALEFLKRNLGYPSDTNSLNEDLEKYLQKEFTAV